MKQEISDLLIQSLRSKPVELEEGMDFNKYREERPGWAPDFGNADLQGADLRGVDLESATLSYCNLQGVDFRGATLEGASIRYANLMAADLRGANLLEANLSFSDLEGADLREAIITRADFAGAVLNKVQGLPTTEETLDKWFEKTEEGWIVYKALGNTIYDIPDYWVIEEGSELVERAFESDRGLSCGAGVNFGTFKWVDRSFSRSAIWRCLLKKEHIDRVCAPYGTDGKFRSSHLTLLAKISYPEVREMR